MNPVTLTLFGVVLLSGYLAYGSKCPEQESITRYVLCYYEGRTSLNNINLCKCTHIVLTDAVAVTDDYSLAVSKGAKGYSKILKEQKESLTKLFTLEVNESLTENVFESENKTQDLINKITNFIYESEFDGIELYFPLTVKDNISKEYVMGFVKELKNRLENESHMRVKREGYDVFEKVQDDVTTASYRAQTATTTQNNEKSVNKLPVKRRKAHRSPRNEKKNPDEEKTAAKEDDAGKTLQRQGKELRDENGHDIESADSKSLLFVRLPVNPEVIAKKFDLKLLSKYATSLVISTHNLTDESETHLTYHPSRLMGLSDMLNADSILDFLTGLGASKSKIVLTIPATVLKFQLEDGNKTTPRSPTVGDIQVTDQTQLCRFFERGNWTVERDEDSTAPYAFSNKTWLAYEDKLSVQIKAKYIILRELAGGAIYPVDADISREMCNDTSMETGTLTNTLYRNMRSLDRKPRALVLDSLQQDIHDTSFSNPQAGVYLSEYRIVRVVDHSGAVHVIRKNTKTEFKCSRQGYFSHPLGCNKFYRCVKFNQYTDDFTVFEYDCPAGLAFDERWEVCVWPGSLPHGVPCTGSSEIAPVPRSHYECPNVEGYYADPENCRWFFACLDHARDGITPLTAYEFRCPFGLVFNEKILACDWPWNVESCGNRGLHAVIFEHHGGSHSAFQSATYVRGGSHDSHFTSSGQKNSFGESAGNVVDSDAIYLSQGGHGGNSENAYIASHFDDNQQKPSFATLPEYEISGGRILNAGGFVLNQRSNAQVDPTSAAKLHLINGQGNGYSNEFGVFHSSANSQESSHLHKNVENVITQTSSSVTQFPLGTAVPKLSQLVYNPPLSTPASFSAGVPKVQINQELISDYSPSYISSSTTPSIEAKYVVNGAKPLSEGTPAPLLNAELGRKINEVFAGNLPSDFHQRTLSAQRVPNEQANKENLDNIYITNTVPYRTQLGKQGVKFISSSHNEAELKVPSSILTTAHYEPDTSNTFNGNIGGGVYSTKNSKLPVLPKAHQVNNIFSDFKLSTATPSSSIYVHREYISNGVLTGHAEKEQSANAIFLNPQPDLHSLYQSNVVNQASGNGFSKDAERTKTHFEVPAVKLHETSTLHLKTSHQDNPSVSALNTYQVQGYNIKNSAFSPATAVHESAVDEQSLSEINGKSWRGNKNEFHNYVYEKPVAAVNVESQTVPQISQGFGHSNNALNSDRHAYQPTTPNTFATATPIVLQKQDQTPAVLVSTVKPTFFETVVKATSVPPSIAQERLYFAPGRISSPAPFTARKETLEQSTPASVFKGPEYLPPVGSVSVEQFQQVKAENDLTTVYPAISQNNFAKQTFVTTFPPQIFKPSEYLAPVTGVALTQSNPDKLSKTSVFESKFVQRPIATTPTPKVYKAPEYLPPPVLIKEEKPDVVSVTKSSVHHNNFVQQAVVTSSTPDSFKALEYLPPVGQVESKQAVAKLTILKSAHQQHVNYQPAEKTKVFQSIISENQNIRDQHQQIISQPIDQALHLPEKHDQTLNFIPSTTAAPVTVSYEERQIVEPVSQLPITRQKDIFFDPEGPKHFQSFVQQPQVAKIYNQKNIESAYNFAISTGAPNHDIYSKPSVQVTTPSSYSDLGLKSIPSSTPQILPYQRPTISPFFESTRAPVSEQHFVEHKEISSFPTPEVYKVNTFVAHSTTEPSLINEPPAVKQVSLTIQTEDHSSQQPYLFQQHVTVSSPKANEEGNGNYLSPLEVDKAPQARFFKRPIVVPENPKENILQQILLQPETNVQRVNPSSQSDKERVTLTSVRNKKPKTIYFENYTRAKPLSSVLAHEIVQPFVQQQTYVTSESPIAITNLIPSKEDHHRDDEDALAYGNFEFQKIGKIEASSEVSQQNVDLPTGVKMQTGLYESPEQYVKSLSFDNAKAKYKVSSNIKIAPPPSEYLLAVTPNGPLTTATPQVSSVAPTVYKTWNQPATSTEKYIYSSSTEPDDRDYYHQSRKNKNGKVTVFSIGQLDKDELDEENVESLLQKYSGDFGNVLGGGRSKFVTKIVQGESEGQIPVGNEKDKSNVGYEVGSFRSRNRDYSKTNYQSEQEENQSEESSVATLDLKNLKIKKNKKTVIVVSQVSDFNPLLIGKLAGQCSCQSNKIHIRGGGRRSGRQKTNSSVYVATKSGDEITSSNFDDSLAIEAVTPVSSTVSTENVILIDSSRVTGKSHLTPKKPPFSTTEAIDPFKTGRVLFKPEESRERRPVVRGKSRSKYGDEISNNDLSSPLFTPVAAHKIASTVDYASVNSNGRSESKSSRVSAGAAYDRYGPGGLRGYDETLQGSIDCERPGLFRHPKHCNKFYACNYDPWKKRYILHVFNCPIHLSYDSSISACNWPSKGPACADDNLLL